MPGSEPGGGGGLPEVRFDALRPPRPRSFSLIGFERAIVAETLDGVPAAVAAAEQAVADGRHVAGWVSYEAAPAFDRALRVRPVARTELAGLPLVWFGVFAGQHAEASPPSGRGMHETGEWSAAVGAADHFAAVEEIRRLIADGETYQVNLTFALAGRLGGDPLGLYADLTAVQRAGYCAYLDTGRWVVASVSPELFFRWERGRITCRPMKGTTGRGRDLAEDEAARDRLVGSEKDRAENLMIVDMVRNDLGRIARTGSVTVEAMFTPERYDTLWQLTSTVSAELGPEVRLRDVFAALFPSASVTGAPKVATMRLISELEPEPRGVYCGAIGYGQPGAGGAPEWVFNVAIRTVLIDREAGVARYGTGGGVTFDSTGGDEHAEAMLKAAVLEAPAVRVGLLETMRWDPATGFRHLDRHLARLAASAEYFAIPLDGAAVQTALDGAVGGGEGPARVRLEVGPAGETSVTVSPAPRVREHPVRLAVDTVPVDPSDPLLRHKTTRRDVYEAARHRHPEADDVILVNDRGEVTETTIANLVVHLDGRWVTPPVNSGCLPGIERAALLESGRLEEAVVTIDDLGRAGAIARCNSLRGREECVLAD